MEYSDELLMLILTSAPSMPSPLKSVNLNLIELEINKSEYNKASFLPNLGSIYFEIGEALRLNGQFSDTIPYYKKSLEIQKDLGDIYFTGVILNNLGLIYRHIGLFQESIKHYYQALNKAEIITGNVNEWIKIQAETYYII